MNLLNLKKIPQGTVERMENYKTIRVVGRDEYFFYFCIQVGCQFETAKGWINLDISIFCHANFALDLDLFLVLKRSKVAFY